MADIDYREYMGETGHPDHNKLMALSESDPEAFEIVRTQMVEAEIAKAPEDKQQRLKGLQFQVDGKRALASNPVAGCIAISGMMHESFSELRTALNNAVYGESEQKPPLRSKAKVLHLKKDN